MKMNIFLLCFGCMLLTCTAEARRKTTCSVDVSSAKDGENGLPCFYEDGENGKDGEAGKNGLNGGNGGNGGSSNTGNGGNGGNGGDAE